MTNDKRNSFIHVCACAMCDAHPYSAVAKEHRAINRVLGTLDEKNRRRFVGLLALQWGRGGVVRLREITGLSRNTIGRGRAEIQRTECVAVGRIRQVGGGRPSIEKKSPVF